MKRKVLIFIWIAIVVILAVPITNLALGNIKKTDKWWRQSVIYNMDFALPWITRLVYPLGISLFPNQTIIGFDNWLYLGDLYALTITAKRNGSTEADHKTAQKIGVALSAWDEWLHKHGVTAFKIMLGPDKETIYPEFLPNWARPAVPSPTDTLMKHVEGLYVDTRPALHQAKTTYSAPLYYKTDTHWNKLGAWIAFRTFTNELSRTEKGQWLTDKDVKISETKERGRGDLSSFLRVKKPLKDQEMAVEILRPTSISVSQYDFETGKLISSTGNPHAGPILSKSPNALNQKKVLWLRDSFGTAISPFMAATFSETLQLHYGKATPERFAELVQSYKPDYVFMTVVERDSRSAIFENPPIRN